MKTLRPDSSFPVLIPLLSLKRFIKIANIQVEDNHGTRKARYHRFPHHKKSDSMSVRKPIKARISIAGSYEPLRRVADRIKIGMAIKSRLMYR